MFESYLRKCLVEMFHKGETPSFEMLVVSMNDFYSITEGMPAKTNWPVRWNATGALVISVSTMVRIEVQVAIHYTGVA